MDINVSINISLVLRTAAKNIPTKNKMLPVVQYATKLLVIMLISKANRMHLKYLSSLTFTDKVVCRKSSTCSNTRIIAVSTYLKMRTIVGLKEENAFIRIQTGNTQCKS